MQQDYYSNVQVGNRAQIIANVRGLILEELFSEAYRIIVDNSVTWVEIEAILDEILYSEPYFVDSILVRFAHWIGLPNAHNFVQRVQVKNKNQSHTQAGEEKMNPQMERQIYEALLYQNLEPAVRLSQDFNKGEIISLIERFIVKYPDYHQVVEAYAKRVNVYNDRVRSLLKHIEQNFLSKRYPSQ